LLVCLASLTTAYRGGVVVTVQQVVKISTQKLTGPQMRWINGNERATLQKRTLNVVSGRAGLIATGKLSEAEIEASEKTIKSKPPVSLASIKKPFIVKSNIKLTRN